tara:strand:- start:1244 stop:1633 length:390 start_codon:yes stop_codon:yes gene_type:complete
MKNWIVIILLVYGSFILYIISNKWEKNIQDNWLLKNNTNLIEHYIYSEIDSLGKEGRQTLFKLADGSMFLLYIYSPPRKRDYYNDKINIGDTLIGEKNSKQFLVIKKGNNDTIRFEVMNHSSDYKHLKE